jgi:hypothetical protein
MTHPLKTFRRLVSEFANTGALLESHSEQADTIADPSRANPKSAPFEDLQRGRVCRIVRCIPQKG